LKGLSAMLVHSIRPGDVVVVDKLVVHRQVEVTNVHYPTDSTLLRDGMRVLTRTMQRARAAMGAGSGRIRDRLRSVTRRVLIIGYEARSPKTRDALVKSYRKLMATTRAVLRDSATMVRRLGQRVRTARPQLQPLLRRAQDQLQQMRPLVQRVVDQTRARLLGGDTHVPDKVLSVFEPHTETIRKGKVTKPNELASWSPFKNPNIRSSRATTCIGSARPTSACGRPRWIATRPSLATRLTWLPLIAGSPPRGMNKPPSTGASAG
jgi:IS5 family transposase